ncbi:probable amino acid permease 7 isoform X1 [Olea europaea subsp. europaea]|uniref:Probable amino acid permease 7 isoform X1 n=1 Tax=Olea europaea subsp. europaea TaxID=158383 RepID=A0A8S0VHR9_OLEEU|nr:probable amino acid permease 7 isoform X1 [Olea europaea subsp. europaea]
MGMEICGDDQNPSVSISSSSSSSASTTEVMKRPLKRGERYNWPINEDPELNVTIGLNASEQQAHVRDGNVWTALAHIITAVIGSGVLSLAWSMSRLGWIAGPLTMLAFASVTLTSALLLRYCYKSPDPDYGPARNASYIEAVRNILGRKNAWVCGIIVRINFIKLGIVYTIASSISMSAIQRSNCYHTKGHEAACKHGNVRYMLTFGIIQIIASQIPDFRNTIWLSVIAAIMSFTYSIIGSALGLAEVIQNGVIKGSIGGVPTANAAGKVWAISEALGDIAFAFPFSVIFLEIQVRRFSF